MKVRRGFVSNSSSTSYTCDVCGEECSGMDMGLSDAEMMQCVHGHTFCESHKTDFTPESLSIEQMKKDLSEYTSYNEDREARVRLQAQVAENDDEIRELWEEHCDDGDDPYDVDIRLCPICQFTNFHAGDGLKYLLKTLGKTAEQVLAEMKESCGGDYKALVEQIKDIKI